jgi:hypothetical protein
MEGLANQKYRRHVEYSSWSGTSPPDFYQNGMLMLYAQQHHNNHCLGNDIITPSARQRLAALITSRPAAVGEPDYCLATS